MSDKYLSVRVAREQPTPFNGEEVAPMYRAVIAERLKSEVERLRWGADMACENTPTAGCETARERAENGEAGP